MTNSSLQTLASYVPALVIRRFNAGLTAVDEPSAEAFPALALFADISGFTALTERLAARGPSGAEDLTRYLNTYFGELIQFISEAGGDTVKFAGDALLALWPAQDPAQLPALALTVASVAQRIQARMNDFEVGEDVRLSLKVAVGAGQVAALQLGGVFNRWELLVAGSPLSQVGIANGQAVPGDLVLSPEAWALLAQAGDGEVLGQGVVRLRELQAPPPLALPRIEPGPDTADALRRFIPGAIRARLDAGQSDWLAELRMVTVVFINLPDFTYETPLERAQESMRALQTALYRFEGSINKISVDDKGASLIAVLGLPPLAHEDDPERGLRAAQMMQDSLTELGFRSSVGVTTGMAFCGAVGSDLRREYTVMGDVVNLAARLMVAAAGGILCDAPTAQAAGSRVDCVALAPMKLKGKTEPVAVFRPGRRLSTTRAAVASGRRLVGRDVERTQLLSMLRDCHDAVRRAVLVQGEPGMGSSALIDELAAQAAREGLTVLSAAADAIDSNTPYHLWRPLLLEWLLGGDTPASDAVPDALLASLGEESNLAPLLGVVFACDWPDNETTAKLTGRARADALQALIARLLQHASLRAPVLLALHDAQWFDSASWALLLHVWQAMPSVLLALSSRPVMAPEIEKFLELSGSQRLLLQPLERAGVERVLCEHLAVDHLPAAVVALIAERADGNPYYSETLATALREAGLIEIRGREVFIAAEAGEPRDWQLPGTVEGVVTASIDRLPAPEQLTLKVASVIGRVFSRHALREIYPVAIAEDELVAHLDALGTRDMTPALGRGGASRNPEIDSAHRFRSTLIKDAAYNLMLFSQRRTLHRAVAGWLEQAHADDLASWYPALAHHWRKAGEDSPPEQAAWLKAIDYYTRAGDRAVAAYVNEEAIHFYREALSLLGQLPSGEAMDRRELQLQLALGTAAVVARSYAAPEVQAAYARATELCNQVGDHAQLFRALRGLWQYRQGQGDMQEAARIGQQLIALARQSGESALLLEANRLLGNNAYWTGDFIAARHYMEEAVALFDPAAHAGLVAQFGQDPDVANRGILGWALGFLGYPEQAQAQIRQAVARAEAIDHPFSRVFAYGAAMWNQHFLSEIDSAEHWAERLIELARERGFAYLEVAGQVVRNWARARRGVAEGITDLEAVLAQWRASGATIGMHLFLVVQANVWLHAGRPDEVRRTLSDPVLSQRSVSERWLEAEVQRLRGEVAAAAGQVTEAEMILRQAWGVAEAQHNRLAQLRIAGSLVRLAPRCPAAADAAARLQQVYAQYEEGQQLGFLREARALLDGLPQV